MGYRVVKRGAKKRDAQNLPLLLASHSPQGMWLMCCTTYSLFVPWVCLFPMVGKQKNKDLPSGKDQMDEWIPAWCAHRTIILFGLREQHVLEIGTVWEEKNGQTLTSLKILNESWQREIVSCFSLSACRRMTPLAPLLCCGTQVASVLATQTGLGLSSYRLKMSPVWVFSMSQILCSFYLEIHHQLTFLC